MVLELPPPDNADVGRTFQHPVDPVPCPYFVRSPSTPTTEPFPASCLHIGAAQLPGKHSSFSVDAFAIRPR